MASPHAKNARSKNARLVIVGLVIVLVAITAALLWALSDRSPRRIDRQRPASNQRQQHSKSTRSERPKSMPVRQATQPHRSSPPIDASVVSPAASSFVPTTRHNKRRAPAAVPSSIAQEKDPTKRAKLMRMHRVATARIRVSVLKRRQRLLSTTLNSAKKDGKSADRVKQLEREMRSLGASLREADRELQQAQDEVEVSQ